MFHREHFLVVPTVSTWRHPTPKKFHTRRL